MNRIAIVVLVLTATVLLAQEPKPYPPPKADGPVVELFEDVVDPLIPLLTNPVGGEAGTAAREDEDVFAGLSAIRVSQIQKYKDFLPGWDFRIVEKPTRPGEFRYLRFAWRKLGGSGIMLQFYDDPKTWCVRYVAGPNTVGWGSTSVAEKAPAEWTVVTRDLFQDFGELKIAGIAFTAMDGEGALFDHILLGRTIADLDAATDAALGRKKPAAVLTGAHRDLFWRDLSNSDSVKAAAALRGLLASAPELVPYIRQQLTAKPADDPTKKLNQWIADLDADEFAVRESASKELQQLGAAAIPALEVAAKTSPSPEVRFRAEAVLKIVGGRAVGAPILVIRSARIARVLQNAGVADATKLLEEMARGELGEVHREGAKLMLRREAK